MKNKKSHNILFILIAISVILGIIFGLTLPTYTKHIKFLGDLFLNALKMIIIPLIMTSIIMGISALGDIRELGKLGKITIFYYAMTTLFAVILGLILVNIIHPGEGINISNAVIPKRVEGKHFSIIDVILGLIPSNIFDAMAKTKVLPVIVFSLILGGVLTTLGEKGKKVLDIVDGLNESFMKIVHLIMLYAPIGIFALISARIGIAVSTGKFFIEMKNLAAYSGTVVTGLFIHGFIVLPLILWLITKRNPITYAKNLGEVLLTAFSTASSSATLPLTIEASLEKNNISKESASFVLPLGATINMDGTALYEAVAAVFIAQAFGVNLTFTDQIIVVLTATLASIGAAGIPEAGLVTMILVLHSVGLPLEGISIILAIDWLLDRFRTTINVWGDTIGAAVADKFENK